MTREAVKDPRGGRAVSFACMPLPGVSGDKERHARCPGRAIPANTDVPADYATPPPPMVACECSCHGKPRR